MLDRRHAIVERQVKSDPGRFPIEAIRSLITERRRTPHTLDPRDFNVDPDLILNIAQGGRLQKDPADPTRDPKDLKLEVDHLFPRSMLIALGLGDVADHVGNYRPSVMPANRRKQARMPDSSTDFFGRGRTEVEPAYQAALSGLDRNTYLSIRDARATLIRAEVSAYPGVPAS